MQPLRATRRDPAPSRLAYRIQRLRLTPVFRRFVWLGVPTICLGASLALYLSDQSRQEAILRLIDDARMAVRQRPEFMVRLLAIDGASAGVAETIRSVLPIDFPVSSFDLDLGGMLAKVAALDAVAKADLRVKPGGVLQIDVVERVPVAVWRDEDRLALLDADGHPVAPLARRGARPDLPLIAGWGAERAVPEGVSLIAAAAPLADRLRGLVRVGERRWNVMLSDGQRILLPEAEPLPALEQVIALHEAQDLLARDVIDVDMRNVRRPTVRMGRFAADTMQNIRLIELGAD